MISGYCKHLSLRQLFVAIALIGACGNDGTGPEQITRRDVIRSFRAEVFRATMGGVTTDLLALGATVTISLQEDGTTTGHLFSPVGGEDGNPLDASLAGTFSFNDVTDEVTFDQAADTFVRDMTFKAVRSRSMVSLEGEQVGGTTIIRVVLN